MVKRKKIVENMRNINFRVTDMLFFVPSKLNMMKLLKNKLTYCCKPQHWLVEFDTLLGN